MKFVVGLGNPGLEYKSTKHNIGFNVVRALAKESGIKIKKALNFSMAGRGKIAGEEVMLVLPHTYMNLSGNAISELTQLGLKEMDDLIVICDDINIELGRIRLKKQGSSGGHKGLESIRAALGRDDFARLRVGIATDVHRGDITNYVLSPFKRKEMRNVAHVITLATDAVTSVMEDGIDKAMTKFNKKKIGTS